MANKKVKEVNTKVDVEDGVEVLLQGDAFLDKGDETIRFPAGSFVKIDQELAERFVRNQVAIVPGPWDYKQEE